MNDSSSSIAILLCTFNGAPFLKKQLDSYHQQTYKNWSLWASDDGSSDGSKQALLQFSDSSSHVVHVLDGPRNGLCQNFLSLINNHYIQSDYYAFSDQDDVWHETKLKRAVRWLDSINESVPALYCSRTALIDAHDKSIGFSPLYSRPPSFSNALIQNIASGNTMVFNRKARDLIQKVSHNNMVIHDWAAYLAVTACDGQVYYDAEPSVYYRQHSENVIGNSMGIVTRVRNFISAHQGRKASWNNKNLALVDALGEAVTEENQRKCADFRAIRHGSLIKRLYLLKRSGVYHQQLAGTLTTVSYAVLNRM